MARLSDLATRSLARWHVNQHVAERFWRDEHAQRLVWDVVTISREVGSGGATVAKLVAQQLDFKLWDREILEAMAQRLKSELHQVEKFDEAVPSQIDTILRATMERVPSSATYKRILRELLTEISEPGKVVILGRGAAYVLPQALRVRVVAPIDERVARVSELEGLSERDARKMVQKIDKRRISYGHTHFRVDLDNPLLYDLVISTERTSLEHAAAQVICAVMQRRAALEEKAAPR